MSNPGQASAESWLAKLAKKIHDEITSRIALAVIAAVGFVFFLAWQGLKAPLTDGRFASYIGAVTKRDLVATNPAQPQPEFMTVRIGQIYPLATGVQCFNFTKEYDRKPGVYLGEMSGSMWAETIFTVTNVQNDKFCIYYYLTKDIPGEGFADIQVLVVPRPRAADQGGGA